MERKDYRGRSPDDFSTQEREYDSNLDEGVPTSRSPKASFKRVLFLALGLVIAVSLLFSYSSYVHKKARSQNSNEYIVSLESKISELNKDVIVLKENNSNLQKGNDSKELKIRTLESNLREAKTKNDELDTLKKKLWISEEKREDWKFKYCKAYQFNPIECKEL